MKILPAILTSEHPESLQISMKQMGYIPELTIFVDTWDENYKQWVVDTYSKYYKVVVSDSRLRGSPGRGKNFVLEYFLNSDYTHLIPVDGDDFLWTGSYEKMSKIIERHPADFYHYEYTDFLYSYKDQAAELWWTKEWYKSLYESFLDFDKLDKISQSHRYLKYIYDVDRIAIETKKSAEHKYVEEVYTLEDVHRNLRLKYEALSENMTGYSIRSRDFYMHIKTFSHSEKKRRPRHFQSGDPRDYDFNFDCGFDWHTNDCIRRNKKLLSTLRWNEEDEKIMSSRLPSIAMRDNISYNYKKDFLNKNYTDWPIETDYYVDPLYGNFFEDYRVDADETIEEYIEKKIQLPWRSEDSD